MPTELAGRLTKLVLQSIEIHFPVEQLNQWLWPFMTAVCRKVSEISLGTEEGETANRREYQLGYARLLLAFVERDAFLYSWLGSPRLQQDLEMLYFMSMPSLEELQSFLSAGSMKVYHDAIPGSEGLKVGYQEGIYKMGVSIDMLHKHLFKITELLLDDRPRQDFDSGETRIPREAY